MAFYGFETDRNTLKYRCPAAVYGFECKGCEECSGFRKCQFEELWSSRQNKYHQGRPSNFHANPSWQSELESGL